MHRSLLILPILCVLIIPRASFAYDIPTIQKLSLTAQEHIIHRRYQKAKKILRQIEKANPESPAPSFGKMALTQAQMVENFDFSNDTPLADYSEKNKALCDPVFKNKESSAWHLYICGAASGARSFYLLRKREFMGALKQAKKGVSAMKRVVKKDPNFKDAYLGLGLYNFWRSHYTRHFSFLPFFPDKREEGIAQIKMVIEEGKFAPALARFSLAHIYAELEQYEKAEEIYQTLVKKYPENVTFRVLDANLQLSLKKYPLAISRFERLQKRYPKLTVMNYFLARALFREGKDLDRAEKLFSDFITRHPSKTYQAYATFYLGRIAEKRGDKITAMKLYKKSYRLDTRFSAPLKNLVRLRREKR